MARRIHSLGPGLLALLLGALLLRMLVPVGYMIVAGPAGGPALVLCDGIAAAAPVRASAIPTAHAGHRHDGHDPAHHREAPCPYGALAAPVLPPLPPLVAPPAQPAALPAPVLALAAASGIGAASPPPPATGPPTGA